MTDDGLPLAELMHKAGGDDFLRSVAVAQLLMETDVDGLVGAGRHERSGEPTTLRNATATIDCDHAALPTRTDGRPWPTRRGRDPWQRAAGTRFARVNRDAEPQSAGPPLVKPPAAMPLGTTASSPLERTR